ncbi:hypothetical protein BIW11_12378 [Tropilaelaps mercedesae]|uniref:Uncharacterized protein n=1 Tax=Tropilaelaps mercedesae TaxID=418985 RepID=A0A1V9X7J2_9ACAR|nr:hypothetical protein BIW11_12378 [Tropilaelaps mercedesae]
MWMEHYAALPSPSVTGKTPSAVCRSSDGQPSNVRRWMEEYLLVAWRIASSPQTSLGQAVVDETSSIEGPRVRTLRCIKMCIRPTIGVIITGSEFSGRIRRSDRSEMPYPQSRLNGSATPAPITRPPRPAILSDNLDKSLY